MAGAQAPAVPPIQDNSFLIEEAYNQERGVVQHISTFQRAAGAWVYTFTQEWPLGGIRHQLSYTIPVSHSAGSGAGFGDVALNYRLQLMGSGTSRLAMAPRVSVVLPTGSAAAGRGSGGVGFQFMLPASLVLAPRLVSHLNLGVSVTPEARPLPGVHVTTTSATGGASVIFLARQWMNLMLEAVWTSADTWTLSPGVRWAINTRGGLQIVPGLAYPIALERGGVNHLFGYLSFEHPFSR